MDQAAIPKPACLAAGADLAVVPCKASMLEVRALAQATKALKHAQDIRKGQPQPLIVLSMVGKTYRLTQDMKDAASTLRLRMAKTAITLKQIYADAPGQGTVVWHLGAAAVRPLRRCAPCSAKSCPKRLPSKQHGSEAKPQQDNREGEESYGSTPATGRRLEN